MKTGMFTCGHQRLPIEHAFRDASELGYDGIEIWGGRPHAFAPDLKRAASNKSRRWRRRIRCRLSAIRQKPTAIRIT